MFRMSTLNTILMFVSCIDDIFLGFINDESYERLFVVLIGEKELFSWRTDHVAGESVYLNYLSLFDTRQMVPDMDSYNALQVYAATGGIPELVKLFSDFPDFETAVPSVLRYDSGYSLLMKRLIGRAFRNRNFTMQYSLLLPPVLFETDRSVSQSERQITRPISIAAR